MRALAVTAVLLLFVIIAASTSWDDDVAHESAPDTPVAIEGQKRVDVVAPKHEETREVWTYSDLTPEERAVVDNMRQP